MIDREKRASAHSPMTHVWADVWLERGEGLAMALTGAIRAVDGWLNRTFSSLAAAQARRAARRELYALDDRLLADIGLRRDQVSGCVEAMFRGDSAAAQPGTPAAAPSEDITEVNSGANAGNDGEYKTAA